MRRACVCQCVYLCTVNVWCVHMLRGRYRTCKAHNYNTEDEDDEGRWHVWPALCACSKPLRDHARKRACMHASVRSCVPRRKQQTTSETVTLSAAHLPITYVSSFGEWARFVRLAMALAFGPCVHWPVPTQRRGPKQGNNTSERERWRRKVDPRQRRWGIKKGRSAPHDV